MRSDVPATAMCETSQQPPRFIDPGIRPSSRLLLAVTLLLLLSAVGCGPSSPQAPDVPTLQGAVFDHDGRPAVGVELRVEQTELATRSGDEGRFVLRVPAHPFDLVVIASRSSSIRMDGLVAAEQNEIRIELGEDDEVGRAEVSCSGHHHVRKKAIHRLVRPYLTGDPNQNPDPDARGTIEIEIEDDGEEFEIEVDRMDPGRYVLWIQDHSGVWQRIEPPFDVVHDEGELEFDTEDGDDLPLDADGLDALAGLAVEVRSESSSETYLVGTVPPGLPALRGKCKGENDLTVVRGDDHAEGSVEIKSRARTHDERFEVEMEDFDPGDYEVCVLCDSLRALCNGDCGVPKPTEVGAKADRAPKSRSASAAPELSLPILTGTTGSSVEVPVLVTTSQVLSRAVLTVEYNSDVLHFDTARLGADAESAQFDMLLANPLPPFAPQDPSRRNVMLQVFRSMLASGSPLQGSNLEIVVLNFTVVGNPGDSSPLDFDVRAIDRWHTFITLDGVDVGPTVIVRNGSFTVGGSASGGFTCIGQLHVEADREGKLKLKNKRGDMLPCGVDYVCHLQGMPIQIHDASGETVLEGHIPNFGDDDDDDDDD